MLALVDLARPELGKVAKEVSDVTLNHLLRQVRAPLRNCICARMCWCACVHVCFRAYVHGCKAGGAASWLPSVPTTGRTFIPCGSDAATNLSRLDLANRECVTVRLSFVCSSWHSLPPALARAA